MTLIVAFYSIAADIIVVLHFLWIVFLIFGAFPGRRYMLVRIIHVGGLIFAFLIQVFDWYCPLTHAEIWLRNIHDKSLSYSGSFIIHYIEEIVYTGISPDIILLLTIIVAVMSLYVYLYKKE